MPSTLLLLDTVVGYKTDHSMITLSLLLHSNPRGPGFWKLNTSFLTEIDYVNQIKRTIQETRDEYEMTIQLTLHFYGKW